MKEYRKRNGSGAVYDDPRVAVGAGRFNEVGARASHLKITSNGYNKVILWGVGTATP
jgi:hypothetical protein